MFFVIIFDRGDATAVLGIAFLGRKKWKLSFKQDETVIQGETVGEGETVLQGETVRHSVTLGREQQQLSL